MPYQILQVRQETTPTAHADTDAIFADLTARVEAAQSEGWETTGGLVLYARHVPHASWTYAAQAMHKPAPTKPAAAPPK